MYFAVQLIAQGVLGPELARDQSTPLVSVAGRVMGPVGITLLAAGAAVSAFGGLFGDMLATPRMLFAFGRDGFLPARVGSVHPRYRTPAIAIAAHGAICCAFAITGQFRSLVILATVSTLLICLACALATIQLRHRDVRSDGAPFVLPGGPTVPILTCIVVVWMLTSASRKEFVSVAIVLAVATVLYMVRARTRSFLTGQAAQP